MRYQKRGFFFFFWVPFGSFFLAPHPVCWGIPEFSSFLNNIQGLLTREVTQPIVNIIGTALNHRAYEPATPIGTHGFGFGIETTLVQIPKATLAQLTHQNASGSFSAVFPGVKMLNLHKGLSDSTELGFSLFYYSGFLLYGFDFKWAFYQPEEGPTWAFRINYQSTQISFGGTTQNLGIEIDVALKVSAWTPELLISRKLDFVDPYLGIGYPFISGGFNVSIKNTPPGISTVPFPSTQATGGHFYTFLGMSFIVPNLGIQWALEGTYHVAGYNSVGTKIGFKF